MADDLIAIASDALTVRINPQGAELWSIADVGGREYMTDADPAFWTGHAPVLFPVVGSTAHDRITVDGQAYPMQRHGFARHARFTVVEQDVRQVRLRLTDSAQTRENYPFAFQLDLVFQVSGLRLDVAAEVTNAGDTPLPFSLGFHPAFAWPLPGGGDKAAHRLTFGADEPGPIRRLDTKTGLLLPDPQPSPVDGRELPLDSALFNADAVVWTNLNSHSLRYHAPDGGALDIAFPDTTMLGLWQVPGAHYICIEPWQGHADPQGFAGEFADKPGIVTLAPGAMRAFRLSIEVSPS
jgi:galactose mutarotase-like enzyme